MEFTMWPFGNAYYVTAESICGGEDNVTSYPWAVNDTVHWSGYTLSVRECFDTKCGAKGTENDTACFADGPYCQHGKAECVVNTIQACSKKDEDDWSDYLPFVVCIEENYQSIADSVKSGLEANDTAINATVKACIPASNGLDAEEVLACYKTQYAEVNKESAKNTPFHLGVPYVRITNKSGESFQLAIPDTITEDFLLNAVCDAWKYNGGESNEACTKISKRQSLTV